MICWKLFSFKFSKDDIFDSGTFISVTWSLLSVVNEADICSILEVSSYCHHQISSLVQIFFSPKGEISVSRLWNPESDEKEMGKESISSECPYCRASLATDREQLGI